MLADYHIHTALCQHAEGEAAAYHRRAAELQMPELGFTDHAPNPDGYDPRHRMRLEEFPQYQAMIAAIARTGQQQSVGLTSDGYRIAASAHDGPPVVLFGLEADYYEGCERFLRSWLPQQAFDLVLGSVHYLDSWGFDNPEQRSVWDSVDVTNTWRRYFQLIGALADSRLADVVAHLDLPKKFGYRPSDRDLLEMAKPALDQVAAAGMAIEINTSGLRKPCAEIYPSLFLLSLAKERNIPICFGSDAHSPAEVGWQFDAAKALARSAGYTHAVHFRRRKASSYPLPGLP
ncbi:MAG: histidinol-phosphatase HisJ family protein [Lentisphaerae bacterium]|nr:histidinol-phosphatase HisJ family protein [Lentisphaerota bacterium]